MRAFVAVLILLSGCTAHAKPRVKPVVEVKCPPPPPDRIESRDAEDALVAFHRLKAAETAWKETKRRIRDKYAIDVDEGEGWDEETLKVQRLPKESK